MPLKFKFSRDLVPGDPAEKVAFNTRVEYAIETTVAKFLKGRSRPDPPPPPRPPQGAEIVKPLEPPPPPPEECVDDEICRMTLSMLGLSRAELEPGCMRNDGTGFCDTHLNFLNWCLAENMTPDKEAVRHIILDLGTLLE